MKMNKSLLVVSSLLISTQIQAAPGCRATDLNGNYVMFQNSITTTATNIHTGRCEITILNGTASGNCVFSNGATPSMGGPASINSNCSANVQLDFSPAPGVNITSNFQLQFSPDKQSFIGQWNNNFGVLGTTAGTRYSPALPATPAP